VGGAYAQDLSVQDNTGVPHLPGTYSEFAADRYTPSDVLCSTYKAWGLYVDLAPGMAATLEPFRYDLVNLGREVLAQLSVPLSQNFSDAMASANPDSSVIAQTGALYVALLDDIDALVGTDPAFLLGSWIGLARALAGNATDCAGSTWGVTTCPDFYEWNARVQLTSWQPTPKGAPAIPDGPNDCLHRVLLPIFVL
jgi:hypothetical protein